MLFETTKEHFDKKLIGEQTLPIYLIEIPQKFLLKAISDNEFAREMERHQYGRYVGHHVSVRACEEERDRESFSHK